MPLRDDDLGALWARASTLEERLSGAFSPVAGDDDEIEARLAGWRHLVGGDERLRRRLAFDGLDEARVRPLLGAVTVKADAPLPEAFRLVAELVAEAAREFAPGESSPGDEAQGDALAGLPFAEVHAPALRLARRRLRERVGDGAELAALGPRGEAGCLRGLAERLCDLATGCLAERLARARDEDPVGSYRRMIDGLLGDGMRAFLLEYAALARSIAVVVGQWVESTAELARRLHADADALVRAFGADAGGPPIEVSLGQGDPHQGGRCVTRLRFAGGLDVYYKPRDLGLDLAFAGLLEACRERGAPHALRTPRVLARGGYGWVEGVVPGPAVDADEVALYFERAGALLCMAYLVDLTDCHAGNVIAAGAHPVLIDLETVCHSRARDLDDRYSGAELRARTRIAQSVLGVGLLPEARDEGELRVELGGLASDDGSQRVPQPRWVDLDTDAMRVELDPQPLPGGHHRLWCQGRFVSVREHADAVARGFERTYRFLQEARVELLRPGGPLDALAGCDARFVLRGTLVYGALLERSRAPELSRAGVDRSLLWDVLARAALDDDAAPSLWPVLRDERAALDERSVPHFTAPVASATLTLADGRSIAGYLVGSAMERARARLSDLDEADLQLQLRLLRGALASPLRETPSAALVVADAPGLEDAALRREALALGEQLWALAERGDDGSATWISTRVHAGDDRYAHDPAPASLGDGVAGILVFAAALERSTGAAFAGDMRRAVLRHLERTFRPADARPLGALAGTSSVLYALARAADLARDPSILVLAGAWLDHVRIADIEADTILDVAGGVAGTLLCLATLRDAAEAAGEVELAARAGARICACARRLLAASRSSSEAGALETVAGRALTGFSHGNSGVAAALARLRDDDDVAAGEVIAAALAFERRHFDAGCDNWRDLRPCPDPSGYACSWCHGAPGIGLARALLLRRDPADAVLRRELAVAARTTAAAPLSLLDHLCCGNMGRALALHLMGEALGDAGLQRAARELAAQVVARARVQGGYHTLVGAPAAQQSPALFVGLAGIGYALLRLCDPSLPSPLALA